MAEPTDNDIKLYEVAINNVPFRQAKGLYRFLVDLYDHDDFHGDPGQNWSGMIEGKRGTAGQSFRTVVLSPMENVIRDLRRMRDADTYREKLDEVNVERQRQEVRAELAERALKEIRDELSHGVTANFEFI